jgi:eukaryotic-like serine/threonine-protein kinase
MEHEQKPSRWGSASVAEDGLRPGNVLVDRFRLLDSMGGGRICEIWHAEDMSLGREVAIKTIRVSRQTDPQAFAALLHEGKLLARLQHPGVLPIHDVGSDRGVVFLVTQLVHGRPLDKVLLDLAERAPFGPGDLDADDLRRVLANGTEPEPGTPRIGDGPDEDWFRIGARVMAKLLLALEAVHGRDVVHHDVKPANVVLMTSGHPVLVDFGFGGDRSDVASPGLGRLSCTPNYVAPEQLAHMSTGQDVRTDIYQAGLLFYELLTLKRCFVGDSSLELYDRIVSRRFDVPGAVDRRVPRALEAVCSKAIALSPDDRYQNAGDFRRDLERFLEGTPVQAPGAVPPNRVMHKSAVRRGRLLRFFATVPLVAFMASLVRVWLRGA